jgi:hypothetical protein
MMTTKIKARMKIFFVHALFATMAFAACTKENTNNNTTTLETRGGLTFTAKKADGTKMPNTTVSIAASQSDLNNDNFIDSKKTDSGGWVDFGKINPANYYYKASVTDNFINYTGSGVVQVQAGQDVSKEIILQ